MPGNQVPITLAGQWKLISRLWAGAPGGICNQRCPIKPTWLGIPYITLKVHCTDDTYSMLYLCLQMFRLHLIVLAFFQNDEFILGLIWIV